MNLLDAVRITPLYDFHHLTPLFLDYISYQSSEAQIAIRDGEWCSVIEGVRSHSCASLKVLFRDTSHSLTVRNLLDG
jgi:hypothetical protein